MYSILPTVVAILFLAYGLYILHTKGINRITIAFFIICLTTFFWQFTWAILFQTEDKNQAISLIKIGWLLILFLPTSLYHFLVEITDRRTDLRYVYLSYTVSFAFAVLLITSNYIIDGYYDFFFGFYPKAGALHPFHIFQTVVVVIRGLYITYQKQRITDGDEKEKLKHCIFGIFIYFFAAIDYLCNYGFEFYPPGILFISISLIIIAIVTVRHRVMDNVKFFEALLIAASAGHEMRTPLATLQLQTKALSKYLPELIKSYSETTEKNIPDNALNYLHNITQKMQEEIGSINGNIDSLLTLTSYDFLNEKDFHFFSAKECIDNAIERTGIEKNGLLAKRPMEDGIDFVIYASKKFLIFVIVNLIKNATDSIKNKGEGKINILINLNEREKCIVVTDTGTGIEENIMPHIFDKFFTTKKQETNIGIGLAFSKSVIESFGGTIKCESTFGKNTTFTLLFRSQ